MMTIGDIPENLYGSKPNTLDKASRNQMQDLATMGAIK
jgi:hypothetical protein